jgi:hypothetical protein
MWFNGELYFLCRKMRGLAFEMPPGKWVVSFKNRKTAKSLLKQNTGKTTKKPRKRSRGIHAHRAQVEFVTIREIRVNASARKGPRPTKAGRRS